MLVSSHHLRYLPFKGGYTLTKIYKSKTNKKNINKTNKRKKPTYPQKPYSSELRIYAWNVLANCRNNTYSFVRLEQWLAHWTANNNKYCLQYLEEINLMLCSVENIQQSLWPSFSKYSILATNASMIFAIRQTV